jgi:hypothetical protein
VGDDSFHDGNRPLAGSRPVWYAAYGSNLSRERFGVYLRGGTPVGGAHEYPGCRDPSPPAEDRAWESACELRFGGAFKTWGGGVAMVHPDRSDVPTKLRLYLVTIEQFADVVAQENWLEPGAVDLRDVSYDRHYSIGPDHTYRLVLPLGENDGHPVLTVTQDASVATAAPTIRYLRHIAQGLRESHGCTDIEIADYLVGRPGVAGAFGRDQLASALALA